MHRFFSLALVRPCPWGVQDCRPPPPPLPRDPAVQEPRFRIRVFFAKFWSMALYLRSKGDFKVLLNFIDLDPGWGFFLNKTSIERPKILFEVQTPGSGFSAKNSLRTPCMNNHNYLIDWQSNCKKTLVQRFESIFLYTDTMIHKEASLLITNYQFTSCSICWKIWRRRNILAFSCCL